MKFLSLVLLALVLLTSWWPASVQSAPSWDWSSAFPSSSNDNAAIANQNYQNDRFQRWVAKSFGDEIPRMRDDLIRRKDEGEGAIKRHWGAWTTLNNWKVDSNYRSNQNSDPFIYSPSQTFGTAGSQIGTAVKNGVSNAWNRVRSAFKSFL